MKIGHTFPTIVCSVMYRPAGSILRARAIDLVAGIWGLRTESISVTQRSVDVHMFFGALIIVEKDMTDAALKVLSDSRSDILVGAHKVRGTYTPGSDSP